MHRYHYFSRGPVNRGIRCISGMSTLAWLPGSRTAIYNAQPALNAFNSLIYRKIHCRNSHPNSGPCGKEKELKDKIAHKMDSTRNTNRLWLSGRTNFSTTSVASTTERTTGPSLGTSTDINNGAHKNIIRDSGPILIFNSRFENYIKLIKITSFSSAAFTISMSSGLLYAQEYGLVSAPEAPPLLFSIISASLMTLTAALTFRYFKNFVVKVFLVPSNAETNEKVHDLEKGTSMNNQSGVKSFGEIMAKKFDANVHKNAHNTCNSLDNGIKEVIDGVLLGPFTVNGKKNVYVDVTPDSQLVFSTPRLFNLGKLNHTISRIDCINQIYNNKYKIRKSGKTPQAVIYDGENFVPQTGKEAKKPTMDLFTLYSNHSRSQAEKGFMKQINRILGKKVM